MLFSRIRSFNVFRERCNFYKSVGERMRAFAIDVTIMTSWVRDVIDHVAIRLSTDHNTYTSLIQTKPYPAKLRYSASKIMRS